MTDDHPTGPPKLSDSDFVLPYLLAVLLQVPSMAARFIIGEISARLAALTRQVSINSFAKETSSLCPVGIGIIPATCNSDYA